MFRQVGSALMLRLTFSLILATLCLSSCEKILKSVASAVLKHEAKARPQDGSIADEIRISSASKPEIIAAFRAISKATLEHNRVLVQNISGNQPANELAYSAGLANLARSASGQGELAKRIINAVATTRAYEKDLFIPFDTMRRQMKGMPTWTNDAALARRGYIQILDGEINTYDGAVAYLERGEEPLLRKNFDKQSVPQDVTNEFFRLRGLSGDNIDECNLGMFKEQRLALQCYRDALASATPALANQHIAEATQHSQKSKQFEDRMVAEIRKELAAAGVM